MNGIEDSEDDAEDEELGHERGRSVFDDDFDGHDEFPLPKW